MGTPFQLPPKGGRAVVQWSELACLAVDLVFEHRVTPYFSRERDYLAMKEEETEDEKVRPNMLLPIVLPNDCRMNQDVHRQLVSV